MKIEFEVKKINYRDNETRFTILRAKIVKSEEKLPKELIIKGIFPLIFQGDTVACTGDYLIDNVYGYYINLTSVPETILPVTEKGLTDFIAKRVNRLGVAKAKEIVKTFGVNTLDIIKEDYTKLTVIKGITTKKAKTIYESVIQAENFSKLLLLIQSFGLSTTIANKIYDIFGENSISRLKSNPYSICLKQDDLNKIDFKYAEIIAEKLDIKANDIRRIKAGILDYIDHKAIYNGDLCVKKSDILIGLESYLNTFNVFSTKLSEEEIETALEGLKEELHIVEETNCLGIKFIYLKVWNVIENGIVKSLKTLIKTPRNIKNIDKVDDFLLDFNKKGLVLDKKQEDAVYMALTNNISILTGLPGTGKTQTTSAIVKCIKYIYPKAKITLLAPTGKASNRMTELIGEKASTIHRGLKLHCFDVNAEIEPLNSDFVIIDESSMIDAYIFYKLIQAIEVGTKVLLIGDVNQLPSVGAGLILRDLIDSNVISTTKLTKIFRQAETSDIVLKSHQIVNGNADISLTTNKCSNFIFWKEEDVIKANKKVLASVDRLIDGYGYNISDICILTPMRKGALGTEELNVILQEKLNPPATNKMEYKNFRVGDRVLQTENNYELDVFNGDIGTISDIFYEIDDGIEQITFKIDFMGKEITYKKQNISQLELAYAMTIHKSQGSEFKAVIMPIHTICKVLLSRNLLYTGITRAKEKLIVIGQEEAIRYAINNNEIIERQSLLLEKISK